MGVWGMGGGGGGAPADTELHHEVGYVAKERRVVVLEVGRRRATAKVTEGAEVIEPVDADGAPFALHTRRQSETKVRNAAAASPGHS
jgi:hypothetical protein